MRNDEKTRPLALPSKRYSHLRKTFQTFRTSDIAERFPPPSLDLCYLLTPSQKKREAPTRQPGRAGTPGFFTKTALTSIRATISKSSSEHRHTLVTELAEVWEACIKAYVSPPV